MNNDVVETKECNCPKCGALLNRATAVDDVHDVPEEGDISVCLNCTSVLVFNADSTVRSITKEEFDTLPKELQQTVGRTIIAILKSLLTNV